MRKAVEHTEAISVRWESGDWLSVNGEWECDMLVISAIHPGVCQSKICEVRLVRIIPGEA